MGDWKLCGGDDRFGPGIRLNMDGTFAGLVEDTNRQLIPDPTARIVGSWEIDGFGLNGPGTFQINFAYDELINGYVKLYSSSPDRMEFGGVPQPTLTANYTRAGAP